MIEIAAKVILIIRSKFIQIRLKFFFYDRLGERGAFWRAAAELAEVEMLSS